VIHKENFDGTEEGPLDATTAVCYWIHISSTCFGQ